MKVAIIHFNLAAESGDPRMVFSLAQALKRLGHAVSIYTAVFDSKFFPNLHAGLDIRVIPPKIPLASILGASGIVRKIKERMRQIDVYEDEVRKIVAALDADIDILECHNDFSYQAGLLYKKRNPRVKVVWIMHNPPFYHAGKNNLFFNMFSIVNGWRERMRVKKYLKGIDQIVTLDEERKKMAEPLGIPATILRIPVDFESFSAPLHMINPDQKDVTLLDMGSLSAFRKFEDIILAGAKLRAMGYNAKVILLCRDFWNQKDYKASLIALAENNGMKEFVDFRFDGANETELRVSQKQSTFFVFPNVVNIWGMAAFEAMAAGLPLIVSNVTSVAEILKNGEQAIFVSPSRPDEIAAAIDRLMKNPVEYGRIAQNGQAFVKENLSWTKYAERLISLAAH